MVSPAAPAVDGRLWAVYCASHVRIDLPGRSVVVAGGDRAPDAPDEPGTLTVLTAWNPFGVVRGDAPNRVAGRHLVTAVEAAGLRWHPAAGRAPDGSWEEAGVAVTVADRGAALELGRRWEQLAVYEWSPSRALLSVVACFEERITSLHAAVTDVAPDR